MGAFEFAPPAKQFGQEAVKALFVVAHALMIYLKSIFFPPSFFPFMIYD